MITIVLRGMENVQAYLAALPQKLLNSLHDSSQSLAQLLVQTVQEKLSGDVLNVKTGKLRNSIASTIEQNGNKVTTQVFVAGDVPYAAIQEFGGRTKPHIIEALNAKTLAFQWQGKNAFFIHINHPGSVIEQHAYMSSSLQDVQNNIVSGYTQALSDTLN